MRGDTVVSERYFSGHGPAAISQAFSASKSVLSILVGAALQDGIIRSVDQSVTDYVPELSGRGFDDVSILDLLHMKSGMDYVENDNPFGIHVRFNYTPRLEDEILALRHSGGKPNRFIYKSGDSALLALILKRALGGKTITQYTQERLWGPAGHGAYLVLPQRDRAGFRQIRDAVPGRRRVAGRAGGAEILGGRFRPAWRLFR